MATKKKAGKARSTAAKSKSPRKPAASRKGTAPKKKAAAKKQAVKKKAAKKVAKKVAPSKKAAPAKQAAPKTAMPAPGMAIKSKVAPDRERTPVKDPVKALADAAIRAVQQRVASTRPTTASAPRPAAPPPPPPRAPAPAPRPAPPTASERREHLRVPYGAWVNVVRAGRQEFCLARDISMGGLFLKATPPPALGEPVQLLLLIENESEPLMLGGIVVRRSEGEGGFGVRFSNLDARSAARLRDLVADTAADV